MDTALNSGTRSSPDKFLELSDAIGWVLQRWGVYSLHYIDDFVFIGASEEEVAEQIPAEAAGAGVDEASDEDFADFATVLDPTSRRHDHTSTGATATDWPVADALAVARLALRCQERFVKQRASVAEVLPALEALL